MFELTRDWTEQYKALGVFTESGGIEVARIQERMQELRRRTTQAKAWGIPAEILTPEGVQKLVPYLDLSVILGGGYFPTVGVVDSLRAGPLMREQGVGSEALTVVSGALAASLDELMPELLGDEKAGIGYAINGLISMRACLALGASGAVLIETEPGVEVGPIATAAALHSAAAVFSGGARHRVPARALRDRSGPR
jgi:glycine/D-amino acid oxidase-like deaminating enzyme